MPDHQRQYDQEAGGRGLFKPFGVRQEGDRRYLIFQIWDFEDDDHYDDAMYFVADDGRSDQATTRVMRSRYYAVSPNHVRQLSRTSGGRTPASRTRRSWWARKRKSAPAEKQKSRSPRCRQPAAKLYLTPPILA